MLLPFETLFRETDPSQLTLEHEISEVLSGPVQNFLIVFYKAVN